MPTCCDLLERSPYQNTIDQQVERPLKKGWRRPFCDIRILHMPKDWKITSNWQGNARPIRGHTTKLSCYSKQGIYPQHVKASHSGGLCFIPRKPLILNGGQRRDRTAAAGLFRAALQWN